MEEFTEVTKLQAEFRERSIIYNYYNFMFYILILIIIY